MQRSPNESQVEIKTNQWVLLCAHGGYQASVEACFVDLEGLQEIMALCSSSSILIRLLHLGLFSGWLSSRCSPVVVLYSFKVVIFAAMTKLIVPTGN